MENTIISQLYSLFIFTISGFIIGIFFDVFRILRKSFKTSDFITYIEDIIFWLITGLFIIYVLFKFNNGQIRSYVVIGLVLGTVLYVTTISKYFIFVNVKIITFIKKGLFLPLKLIYSIIKKILKPFSFIVINIRKTLSNIYNKLFTLLTKKSKKI